MEITNEGKILREEAIALFEDIKRIKGNFNEQKLKYGGKIVIATTHVILDKILPLYIEEFQRKHPKVVFQFEAGIREVVLDKVQSGEADFGFCLYDTLSSNFVCHDLYETNLVLLTPKSYSFFKGAFPTLEQIAEAPLILYSHQGSLEPLIEGRFHKEGLIPNVVMTHNNFVSIKEYVSRGMGVSIVGGISAFPDDEITCDVYNLDCYFPKRKYGIILKKKKYLPEMVKDFIWSIDPNINFSAKTTKTAKSMLRETYPLPSHTEFMYRK